MPVDPESRATSMSGRATWVIVIGMVLALAGGSFAMLPAAGAQDEWEPTPVEGGVIAVPGSSSYAFSIVHPMVCPNDVDLAVAATDPAGMGCVTLPNVAYRFVYWKEDRSARLVQERSSGTAANAHPVEVSVGAGLLDIHEIVSPGSVGAPEYQPPRVFCWKWDRDGEPWYENYEITYVFPSSSGGRSSFLMPTFNHPGHREECLWLHKEVDDAQSTPTLPTLQIDPDDLIEHPALPVTPVVPAQLPTSTPTPEMPRIVVTPPVEVPFPIDTPVFHLPTPTDSPTPSPTPQIGEHPVIVITPVIPYPIEIVTPVVPVEPPELIHRVSVEVIG